MKKQTLILMMCVIATSTARAQAADSCTGNTAKPVIDADDALYFKLQELNLNSNDWPNDNINCNINLMFDHYHPANNLGTLGRVLIGVGASGLGATIPLTYYIDGVGTIYAVSVGSILGGVGCLVKATKEKKAMNYNMNTLAEY